MNYRVVGFLIALAVAVASWVLTCAAWQLDRVAAGVVPLDPRSFERLTLVTLGTAGAAEDHNRRGTSIAVGLAEQVLLVDAGRGVAEGLRAAQIPVSQPDVVLLTSALPENGVGLDDLLAAAFGSGRREALRVIGPPGSAALARAAAAGIRAGAIARAEALGDEAGAPAVEVSEVGDGFRESIGGIEVRAAALPGGALPALAWRVESSGRSAVVSSAGWNADAVTRFAEGANLLIHAAAFVPTPAEALELGIEISAERLQREAELWTGLAEVGAIARRARVGGLVLVRLRPPPVYDLQITGVVDDEYDGRIAIAEDGDEFKP